MSCKENGRWFPVELDEKTKKLILSQNQFYQRNTSKTFEDEKNCIFGNGGKSTVVAINGQYPGPTLEVFEGSLVHVKIINKLFGGVSPVLHFHGFKFDHGYYW